MASEDSVQANLSQDDSQPGPSGLTIAATVLGSRPSASTESQLLSVASQGANPTSGELLCEKNGVCFCLIFNHLLCVVKKINAASDSYYFCLFMR